MVTSQSQNKETLSPFHYLYLSGRNTVCMNAKRLFIGIILVAYRLFFFILQKTNVSIYLFLNVNSEVFLESSTNYKLF